MTRSRHDDARAELTLEPVTLDHAPALARQYRDPRIAELTALPPMHGPDEALHWLCARLALPISVHALMHREHGLAGYLEIMASGTDAFLCYWIGADWQGRGWGRVLIRLATEQAIADGADLVLTAAYEHNTASIRALRASGFGQLPVRALHPEESRVFFHFGSHAPPRPEIVPRLVAFCERMNTGLVFADGHKAARQRTVLSLRRPSASCWPVRSTPAMRPADRTG
jgi:RimJ/RimL family protein N-acetyltransferase